MAIRQQKIIGIDIGSNTVQMAAGTGRGTISHAISVEIPDGVISKLQILVPEVLASTIREAKAKGRMPGRHCSLSLGGTAVIIRHITLPFMNDDQIYQNVVNEISTYLPIDTEKYSIDYSVQRPSAGDAPNTVKVMVVAIQKDLLQSYINVLSAAGFKVAYIDITENTHEKLIRAVAPSLKIPSGNFGILDIGADTTNITAYLNGNFYVNKVAPLGGKKMSEELAARLNIDTLSAQKILQTEHILGNRSQFPTENMVVSDVLEQIMFEAVRVFDYFKSRNNQIGIQNVYVCGGVSLMPGFAGYCEDNLHISVTPFQNILSLLFERATKGINYALFAGAAGATFREVK